VILQRLASAPLALSSCVSSLSNDELTLVARRRKPKPASGARAFLVLLFSVLLCAFASPASAKTAMQSYVEAMQPGWNLGNTLDAPNETAWGNPVVTQAFIQQIKAQGFKSIRIPVSWDNHVGPAPTYTVDPAWMNRVQQIVDWSLDAGLYVMLNMHHDSYWIRERPANYLDRYSAIWSQIAPRFRDHSDKLMLETINEPDFLNVDDATKITLVNELNTTCYHIIRNTGGGNATRPIVMPTVVTNGSQNFLDGLKSTMVSLNDPNLIATIHFYGYWPFSVNIAGVTTVDASVLADINNTLNGAYNTFVAAGIPVVVGELGVLAWDSNIQAIERGELLKFFEIFTGTAQSKGITWQLWDNGKHFDRTAFQWRDPELIGYLLGSVTSRSATAATDLVFVKTDAPVDTSIPLNLNGNTFVSLTNGATTLTPGVDYTLDGGVLTLKASALAAYATGAYGEKAVFTANFSAGMPWKLHVRHLGVPVLSAASSIKAADLIIPAAFNGDLVANMESHYVSGNEPPYPGPQSWTAFQGYNDAYFPDYTTNTITIKKGFFAAVTNDPIELTFHMWSGRTLNYRLTLTPGGDIVTNPQEWSIYSDGLAGWNNWGSWASNNPDNTTVVHSGTKAISVDAGAWGALVLGRNWWEPAVDTSAYKTLVFWIHGGTVGGQSIGVGVDWGLSWVGIAAPAANTWKKVEIPLSAFGAEGKPNLANVMFQNWTGANAPTFYVDDIKLTTAYASDIVFVHGAPAPVVTGATAASGMFDAPFNYTVTAINGPATFSATGLPPGLAIDPNTGVISGTPTAAGSYLATVTASNAAGDGTATLALTIAPAPLTVVLGSGNGSSGAPLQFAYDGAPRSVDVAITTTPAGIPLLVTYNGSTITPTLPGTYHVVVTSNNPNYTGTAEGTLVITVTALVRQPPTLNGVLDGSLQLLGAESFALNGHASMSGDLLVPGTPDVRSNGHPLFAGVVDATGAVAPTDYSLTLNSGAVLGYVVRRVDPIAMPVVTAPAKPTGTREVTLNNAQQSPGDFATIRKMTLNGNAGTVAVPAGVYGSFTVNGNSSLVLGEAGATEPAVYEFQSLTLNGNTSVQVVGPVKLKLADGLTLNGVLGSAEHPEWLEVLIAKGGLTLNGNATLHGIVTAPNSAVTISGTLHGRVSADQLTFNGNGLLEDSGL
jgi:aryl-phospho-beta-D-glucosidase BglC (GH1 family)